MRELREEHSHRNAVIKMWEFTKEFADIIGRSLIIIQITQHDRLWKTVSYSNLEKDFTQSIQEPFKFVQIIVSSRILVNHAH